MEQQQTHLESILQKVFDLMGFGDDASYDKERRHVSITFENEFLNDKTLPLLVGDFNHVAQLLAKKCEQPPIFVDINNYQKKREGLIVELARAAARKAVATKTEISLPAMNSYERRLVHMELAAHPEVKTESVGSEKKRYIVVRVVEGEHKKEAV